VTPKDNVFERVHLQTEGSGLTLFRESNISTDPYANEKIDKLLSSDNTFQSCTQSGNGTRGAWGTALGVGAISYENRKVRPPTGYQNLDLTVRVPRVMEGGAGADPDVVFALW
jgi:hypothetical protein